MKTNLTKVFLAVAVCLSVRSVTRAATWVGGVDASWATSGNWAGAPPDSTGEQEVRLDDVSGAGLIQNLNGSYSLAGIAVSGGSGRIELHSGVAGSKIALGAGGIDMSHATADLAIRSHLTLAADQVWSVAAGRRLLVGADAAKIHFNAGTTTTLTGGGTVEFDANQILEGGASSSSTASPW